MPRPRLIHPVPVFIRQIDRKFTARYDHNLKEPIGQVARPQAPIELRAQVSIGATDRPTASAGGVVEDSTGYLLFLTRELQAADVTIDRGDQITRIGDGKNGRDVDYYITHLEWKGHYSAQQGPTLLKAYFSDRHPSRQRGDL